MIYRSGIEEFLFADDTVASPVSTVYRALNGTPQENLARVIEMMGGIDTLIGPHDMVVIKPNGQWWNQGCPNLAALKAFVDMIMGRPGGFDGEVVVVENCHRGLEPWASMHSAWAPDFVRNADLATITNLKTLCDSLKTRYGDQFTTYHLIDVSVGNQRIYHPREGNGYVYCDGTGGVPLTKYDNGCNGSEYRATIMTYPIMTTDKGTVIDLKHGIWAGKSYTDQPLRFVNFAALNHHSSYCGATSAVKNYLGIADLSGGPNPDGSGKLTKDYYNFHAFPFNKWTPGPAIGMLGGAVGTYLTTIRKADLNITTAEWVGLASRTEPPVARTRTVLASTDPVALDYHATKYLLWPNSRYPLHNPDNIDGPLRQYLQKCAKIGAGTINEKEMGVQSYDFSKRSSQKRGKSLEIIGAKEWGSIKNMAIYMIKRFL